MSLSVWLIPLSIMLSRSIYTVENGRISFIFMASIPFYIPHFLHLFICWWILKLIPYLGYYKQCCNEHWGTWIFQINVFIFSKCMPNSRIAVSYGSSIFSFLRNCLLFSIVAAPVYIPTNSWRVSFLNTFSSIYYL